MTSHVCIGCIPKIAIEYLQFLTVMFGNTEIALAGTLFRGVNDLTIATAFTVSETEAIASETRPPSK